MELNTMEPAGEQHTLRSVLPLIGDTMDGVEGELGTIMDVLFDDAHWTIRYCVVQTGNWLAARRVLISPVALRSPDWGRPRIWTSLTKEQVAACPVVDLDRPVTRDIERVQHAHYGWPYYWGSFNLWGMWATPGQLLEAPAEEMPDASGESAGPDPHLRSVRAVSDSRVEARDGDVGHVEDLIMDADSWAIRYIVVNTRPLWFGKRLLVMPSRAYLEPFPGHRVHVDLSRDVLEHAPSWDRVQPIRPAFEQALREYYAAMVMGG